MTTERIELQIKLNETEAAGLKDQWDTLIEQRDQAQEALAANRTRRMELQNELVELFKAKQSAA